MSENAPQDKREQAEAAFDGINRRDFEVLAELVDPEVEFRSVISGIEGETYIGIEGLRKWRGDIDATWADYRTEMLDFHPVGDDQAVVVLRVTGKAKASGVPLDVRGSQLWTWRNGRLWRNQSWTDPHKAFEAAGLSEDDASSPS
jgi:ketosteroid isomerase-like protein